MFVYEKRLQYPVHIKNPNPKLAKIIMTQYGGPYTFRLRKSRSKSAPAFFYTSCLSLLQDSFRSMAPQLSKNSAFPWNSVFR